MISTWIIHWHINETIRALVGAMLFQPVEQTYVLHGLSTLKFNTVNNTIFYIQNAMNKTLDANTQSN